MGKSITFFFFLAIMIISAPLQHLLAEESRRAKGEVISHIHGLAVDPVDTRVLLVATHHGLFRCRQEGECSLLGDDRSDFMGFSISGDGKTFYVSGHDVTTHQNIGLKRSTDRGRSWEVMAFGGRVDFHTMTVNPSNPDIIYGWYGRLYKSQDGGRRWSQPEGQGLPPSSGQGPYSPFINILTDQKDPEMVFGATEQGFFRSDDGGKSWLPVKTVPPLPVVGIAIDRSNRNISYLFVFRKGLIKSVDGMKGWEEIGKGISKDEVIGNIAVDPKNGNVIYAATFSPETRESKIYRSDDGGKNFKLIIGG